MNNNTKLTLSDFNSGSQSSFRSMSATPESNSPQQHYLGTPVHPSPTMSACHLKINQSMSDADHESVFALCLPDTMPLPPVTRLQHIQSQTPRTPGSCVDTIDTENNTHVANIYSRNMNIHKNSLNTGELTMERARALSATEVINLSLMTNDVSYKLNEIVSPSLKAVLLNNASSSVLPILSLKYSINNSTSTNNIIHSMNNSINNNTGVCVNDPEVKIHHSSETTPIHELIKSSMNMSVDQSSSVNNIEMLCVLLENEEKDAMDAIFAECSADEEDSKCDDVNKSSSNGSSNHGDDYSHMQTENDFLLEHGYKKLDVLTTTLQGCVFKARNLNLLPNMNREFSADEIYKNQKNIRFKDSDEMTVVIKRTNKELYEHGITIQDGKQYSVDEDIVKEMKLMKYFQTLSPPSALIKYLDFFESSTNYYLVMEDGGIDCFDFAVEAHAHIANGRLKIKEWRKFCKFLFWQMTLFIKWMHSEVKCCHLDISLENLLLQDAEFIPKKNKSNELTLSQHVQIKFCDFGLAEFFDANNVGDFRCTKYCGKVNYKAPQVYHKEGVFDARKADIWSLGIVFFSMVIGAPPYIKPIVDRIDDTYDYVERGCISQLLYDWERNDFVTLRMLDLINGMLTVDESDRFSIKQIFNHPWLRLYKEQYSSHSKLKDIQHKFEERVRSASTVGCRKNISNETKSGILIYKVSNNL